jgi:two-component system NarL family sensor kinase
LFHGDYGYHRAQTDGNGAAELAKNILTAQEQERHRVSRELHDGISQLLSSARHRLHDVEKEASRLGRRKLSKDVTETRDLLERTMREVRLISRNLRPSELDDLGLSPALQGLVEDYQLRTKIRVDCKCYLNREPLEKDAELAIYRIIQEALTNISKHAEASEVAIRLTQQQGQLLLYIRDNGRGFDVSKQHGAGLGLANMRERASFMRASLSVHSMPWQGTEIRLEIPSC